MGAIWRILWISATFCFFHSTESQYVQIVNKTNISWTIEVTEGGGFLFKFILSRKVSGFGSFACGFQCSSYPDCNNDQTFLFGIFAIGKGVLVQRLVWSSNRNKPVGSNATLILTGDGDLILQDFDATLVWSTNTTGKSVAGVNLTDSGNLVLFDENNSTVWQSFDHPTDTLLSGQKLNSDSGQKLIASTSSTNWSQGGMYSLSLTDEGLSAFMESNPSLVYSRNMEVLGERRREPRYAILLNGSFAVFAKSSNISQWATEISLGTTPLQHVTLDFDGHLRVYDLVKSVWQSVADVLTPDNGACGYPLVCGRYGICSNWDKDGNVACSCLQPDNTNLSYFKQTSDRHPNLGCSLINSLSCDKFQYQKLIELKNVTHVKGKPDLKNTDVKSCKLACLNNCSCKAAMFDSRQNCYLATEIFSLENVESNVDDTSHLFLKVQDDSGALPPPSKAPNRRKNHYSVILESSLGSLCGLLLSVGIFVAILWKKKDYNYSEEDNLDQVPGMPNRYTYKELIATTDNFSKKLGQGGFGSVFEGTLSNGTMVAVKCLGGLGQIKESFLCEVKTIGSIHHVNLVRLIGYCTDKSHRLLVYEFMCNGSLDKWIFHRNRGSALDWQIRRMIILDIAKGLAYLHEECRQKIFHLDIKPENILLDEHFRAKVGDFGLSKLIDRDQSQVVTRMKGTPGYLAPEWLNSVITEKVDVYSFGVVVLEILCGRKNLDRSQQEEEMHLLSVFKRKAEQDQLVDMIDKNSEDMLSNGADVLEMMKLAAWCLQSDYGRRPSMSAVVKVLEGSVDVEENLEYDFSIPAVPRPTVIPGPKEGVTNIATPLLPSALSGPR